MCFTILLKHLKDFGYREPDRIYICGSMGKFHIIGQRHPRRAVEIFHDIRLVEHLQGLRRCRELVRGRDQLTSCELPRHVVHLRA